MRLEQIHNNGHEYLDQFLTKIPANCLLDKGKTGCGGTTLAIKNDIDTIILMPFVSLIKNKRDQHANSDELLCVFGKQNPDEIQPATDEEIIEYVTTKAKQKILVTYNSFARLVAIIQSVNINPFEKYFCLIDEWHILFNSYIFRNKAIKEVIELSTKFNRVTFMSATPIEDEFILEEIKHLPIQEVVWDNVAEITIESINTPSPKNYVKKLIQQKLENKLFGNVHIFVNSVSFIAEVVKALNIDPSNVKIICSKQLKKAKTKNNQAILGEEYPIAEPLDPVKPINFYTSASFEGCDIYDPIGKTYIVSNKFNKNTLHDIQTLSIQIIGRIRNSNYNSHPHHIFNETRYAGNVTLEEFKASTYSVYQKTKKWVDKTNEEEEEDLRKININHFLSASSKDVQYAYEENGKLHVDKNLYNLDIMNWRIVNEDFKCRHNVTKQYKEAGLNVLELSIGNLPSDKLKANPKSRINFKEYFTEYASLREAEDQIQFKLGNYYERIDIIEAEKPITKEAFEKLGSERVAELGYNLTKIKRELVKRSSNIEPIKIKNLLTLKHAHPYTAK